MTKTGNYKVECRSCKSTVPTVLHSETLLDGRTGYFLLCPKCGMKYPSYSLTPEAVALLPELEKARVDYGKRATSKAWLAFTKLQKEYQKGYTKGY